MSDIATRPRRSYSRLDLWQQCPQAYKAKYVDRVAEEPSVWTVGGTAFHTVAERYLLGELGENPESETLWTAWMDAWRVAYNDVIQRPDFAFDPDMGTWRAAGRGRETAVWWENAGFDMVQRFVYWKRSVGKDLTVLELDGRPALETEIEVELGGVPIIAIPDAVVVDEHGQLGILDYKTGKPPKKATQLEAYAAAIAAKYGLSTTWGLYYMARPAQLLPRLLPQTHDAITEAFVEFDARERAGEYDLLWGQECLAYQCPTHTTPRRRR